MANNEIKVFGTIMLGLGILLLCGLPLPAQDSASPKPTVKQAVRFAVSEPLRELAKRPRAPRYGFHEALPVRHIAQRDFGVAVDPVEQNAAIRASANYFIGLNLLGVGNGFPNYNVEAIPPDTNLAVGDTQIVQWVNLSFAIFNKTTGAIEAGPIEGNQLWAGFGTECPNNNDGDIIGQWDNRAHRWLLVQNVFHLDSDLDPPYYACVAVSQTPDALGAWYLYQFSLGDGFPDYPKWGRWTNSWTQTMNNFGPYGSGFLGPEVCVYDRTKLIAGDPTAGQVCFQLTGSEESLLPADIDSPKDPPAGEDIFLIGSMGRTSDHTLSLYSVHIDWANPNDAIISGSGNSQVIEVPSYNTSCGGRGYCVPQKDIPDVLESMANRLMYRFAYWDDGPLAHVGTHAGPVPQQHWYVNSDVDASGGQVGVRWYEFRAPVRTVPVTSLTTFQAGTYAPDLNYRWMGSVAQDKVNDILVGYSISSSNMYPSIAVAGRQTTDPLGTLEPEAFVVAGTGSQPADRWGDYSSMRIDQDGCTFWYTTEYYMVTQNFDWSTQIASIKFANCQP